MSMRQCGVMIGKAQGENIGSGIKGMWEVEAARGLTWFEWGNGLGNARNVPFVSDFP
jgi:hypothetical protein